MKKLLKAHEEKDTTVKADSVKEGALPPYLLDREKQSNSKILANTIK
jgi:ribosome biogenesis protein NSA2